LDDDAKRVPCSSDTRSQVGEGIKTYSLLVNYSGFGPYHLIFLGTGPYGRGVRIRFLQSSGDLRFWPYIHSKDTIVHQ